MAIIDVTTYNGEAELFELRYNILKDQVDEFRVIEFDKTFSGKSKEKKFNQHWDKVKYYPVPEWLWEEYWQEAKKSPNTNYGEGAKHWLREWCMKESIKDCLTDLQDDDIVFIGDVDEIPYIGEYLAIGEDDVFKYKLRVYTYWLNNRSTEEFYGTILAKYKNIKNNCLNHIRSKEHIKLKEERGWHFTSMGGYDKVKEKLQDSYTEETYANKGVLTNLYDNIKLNKDFLGRNFEFKKDESDWPQYLKDHKNKYSQLCLEHG